MSYYISPAKVKSLSSQTKKLNTVNVFAAFIGLTPGIIPLVFGSSVSANQVFINTAKKGKGVQLNYIVIVQQILTARIKIM
ncbi:hypothetical protein [Enterococcus mediterraneensis]|uniref:hypothetical protein n=1 Tax=Enterococcus mediterraneensis TaxID=2364791 RepID=UPI001F156F59|nr:hypothetical protein [Enterococcus mediterraneensis]